ncbi:hypothetical protein [Amycolatopsis suaedae]|uniref:hypothetical protein n=1 Tax=Amycolatopsis suaedae TaxID=2510978 RepID=UPI00196BAFC2|nr:hypothetical protein [Amycolatopsis suaedae]
MARSRPEPDAPSGLLELAERFATPAYLANPRLHRWAAILLGLFTVLSLVAVLTRGSALPLLPLPLFVIAGLALWRLHRAGGPRPVLGWSVLLVLAGGSGFWAMSGVAKLLDEMAW